MQKVERAKKLIDDNISNTYTIIELSKMIGTNEQYLKQYFKQQYGMTIRTYILKNKMNHAKELLINGNDKVAVIATKIGYKHATHFTTAFKKYFGFLPNSIRFNWLAYLSPYSLELLCTI
jgi:AraC-like DNA-binding protein